MLPRDPQGRCSHLTSRGVVGIGSRAGRWLGMLEDEFGFYFDRALRWGSPGTLTADGTQLALLLSFLEGSGNSS